MTVHVDAKVNTFRFPGDFQKQKQGVVVTHIEQSEIELLTPESGSGTKGNSALESVVELMKGEPLRPFAEETRDFLKAFSKTLVKQKTPELVALGYWLRESQIKRWNKEFQKSGNESSLLEPLGAVLHFTPANVDTMFVYSWVCSLMLGNINVLRLSNQASEVKQQLLDIINEFYQDANYRAIAARNCFIYYPHSNWNTSSLSQLAAARILWGGDEAVMNIRSVPANPRTRDIGFADRYSVCLINGDNLSSDSQIQEVADAIWKDTSPYSQMACSSPKVLFWSGETKNQQALLVALNNLALASHRELNQATNHLVVTQLLQAQGLAGNLVFSDAVTAVHIPKVSNSLFDVHTGNALFYVKQVDSLNQVLNELDSKCQTLSYWGIDKQVLIKHLSERPINPIDRVVPVGQSLDFSPVWDGYDLMHQLCRKITVL